MGLDNRDYVRNDPRTASTWSPHSEGGMTRALIFATVIVFIGQMVSMSNRVSVVTGWLQLDFPAIQRGQVWRLVTYAFCHSTRDLLHILFNMFVLWWAGRAVEALYGGREFLRFYFVAAIASSLAYVGLALLGGQGVGPMLGASGCTMACFAVFAMHYPRARVYLFGVVPVEARWLLVGYVFLDMRPVLMQLLGGGPAMDGIAHSAHLGGLAFGLWYKWSGTRVAWWFEWFGRRKGPRPNPNVKIYDPTPEELEERVDSLLDKIREEGEGSLTDAEREFLKEASKHYRGR